MTGSIQDTAKPQRLPARPQATMSPKMLDFALRTKKEACRNKSQSELPNQKAAVSIEVRVTLLTPLKKGEPDSVIKIIPEPPAPKPEEVNLRT
ncbi:MAG TPA: hypothetical protein VFG44_03940 [Burkholderiales bacterium]|nr:hypothetical protein [Burkholderiales bacterium]